MPDPAWLRGLNAIRSWKRREFIALLGGVAARRAGAQPAMPVIAILGGQSPQTYAPFLELFRLGLNEMGYRAGHNLAIESHLAQGRYDPLPDLSATSTIPIVFANGGDPVKSGLVASS